MAEEGKREKKYGLNRTSKLWHMQLVSISTGFFVFRVGVVVEPSGGVEAAEGVEGRRGDLSTGQLRTGNGNGKWKIMNIFTGVEDTGL